jgi:hypothetical protein
LLSELTGRVPWSGFQANLWSKRLKNAGAESSTHDGIKVVCRCAFACKLIPVDTVGRFSHEQCSRLVIDVQVADGRNGAITKSFQKFMDPPGEREIVKQ